MVEHIKESQKIKCCPFCGSEARVMHMDYDGGTVYGVFCDDDLDAPYSHGHYIDNYATEEEAISAWNNRHEKNNNVVYI